MRLQWRPEGRMSLKVMGDLLAVHGIARLRLRCRKVRYVHSIVGTRQSHSRTVRGIVRYRFDRCACLMRTKSRKQIRSAEVPIRGTCIPVPHKHRRFSLLLHPVARSWYPMVWAVYCGCVVGISKPLEGQSPASGPRNPRPHSQLVQRANSSHFHPPLKYQKK